MQSNKRFMSFVKSLRFRLILLILVIIIAPGILLCLGVLNSYEARTISIRESEVLGQTKILSNLIATSEYVKKNGSDTDLIDAKIEMLTTIYNGRVLVVDRNFDIVEDTYDLDNGKTIISEEVIRSFSGEEIINYDSANNYIELSVPVINPDDAKNNVVGVVVVSVSTDTIALNIRYLTQVATIIEIALFVIFLFFGVLAIINIMNPLKYLTKELGEIQSGYRDDMDVSTYTETEEISQKINAMLSEMKIMDESRQEFVSNVSHELKTPLTSMKVLADSINSMGSEAPKELYQEFMEDITNEIERETKIINDLLSLVKMDKTAVTLNIETVNINELLELILKRLQPIADKQKVSLVLESFRPVSADVDEVKLTLALTNLIENAIKYNKNDGEGWVHVSLNADHQYFFVKVEDSGMGIPEDALEHIYERFYRVDKSHSREIGGTGLGLAITRSSILMHRGAIKAHSVLGEGTTFDVRIPLKFIV
ncbi:MAG: HAMP domain-containing sensor histidine kinase [Agathobacter sp.]|nr:HAMP domain-containing sensor histidine kinase [Agathobacter sp.]